tara:strand:- start:6813 stop:8132 length:1320 start_codon:yes stop_codon:yes gene_type:complete
MKAFFRFNKNTKIQKHEISMKNFLLIVSVVFVSACKKDWNELGSQLVVQEELTLFSFDEQPLELSLVKEDSLSTLNRPTFFLGSINSEIYGQTEAQVYTELSLPSSNVNFGPSAQVDSLVLTLDVTGYYGDTLSPIQIRVMEMLESIETSTSDSEGQDSTLSIFSFQEFDHYTEKIGEKDFYFVPAANGQIRISMSIELGQYFLEADPENFVDNETFQSFFKGLFISCESTMTRGLLLEISASENSKLSLYYHTDEASSLIYDFEIDNNADKMTHWSQNHSSDIELLFGEENISFSYVQGGVGLRTYIDLPNLSALKDSNFVIHKAELVLPYLTTENDEIYTLPVRLGLAGVNSEGKLEVLNEDQNIQGSTYFDGTINEINNTYTFNIARYIQKVIREDYTSRLALYVPTSVTQPERVMLINGELEGARMQLKLVVSKY